MVSISWLLGLAFLYRLRFLTNFSNLDWQLTLTTQLCTSKLPDNPVNGLHVLDRLRLARVKTGKNWQGKAANFGLQLACTGRGWLGPKIGQACQRTSASLARIKLQGLHTCSEFTLSGQSYRI